MASVEIVVAELHVPGARSLKQKRSAIKSVIDRVHQRLRVSIAETDHHDLLQRSELTIAVVLGRAGSRSEEIRRIVELDPTAFVTRWDSEIVDLY